MASRLELQEKLEEILGSTQVYFQPPESVKMSYPAIVYSRENIWNDYADDTVYAQQTSYRIIVMDKDPDSEIVKKVSQLPTARFNTHYAKENLNHDVFIVYF